MQDSNKADKIKPKKNFLATKYFCLLIGFCLVIISIILWKSQESNDLSGLYSQAELKAKYYSSDIEVRFNRIYNALARIAYEGQAYEEINIDRWEKDTAFYIASFKGIEDIIWVDRALRIKGMASLQYNESNINKRADEVFNNPSEHKLWFPIYDDTELDGFIVGIINIDEFVSPAVSDIESGYMLQLREEDKIVYSSENWKISGGEVIFNEKSTLQNTKVWDLSVSPTRELVNSEIVRSVGTLLYSLLLSLAVIITIFFAQNAYMKSKLLQHHQEHLEAMISDRTKALKKSEAALAKKIKEVGESEKKYRTIFENTGTAVMMVEEDMTISLANSIFEKFSGYSRSEIENKKIWTEFVVREDLAKMKKYYYDRRAGKKNVPTNYEFGFVDKTGDVKNVFLTVAMVPGTKKSILSLLDITELKKAEEKIKKYSEDLEIMVEKRTRDLKNTQEELIRKEKLAVLGQLAGGVSHELRNPLGAIKNAVYFLNMVLEKPEPDIRETLVILDQEVNTAEGIISSILDFARPGDPIIKKVDIANILQKIISDTSVPEGITVLEKISKALPKTLIDPGQARQIFSNIINNAIQAMPDGGKLTIRSKMPDPDRVEISISDTGIGIPEENMKKLFEPLFTTRARGIGLGLSLTRSMVEANGGKIGVKSTEGEGTTFKVVLPLVKREAK